MIRSLAMTVHKGRGVLRGPLVSRTRILSPRHRAYGICRQHGRDGSVVLRTDRIFRHLGVSEIYGENLHSSLLGLYDRDVYRFQLLDSIQNGLTALIRSLENPKESDPTSNAGSLFSLLPTFIGDTCINLYLPAGVIWLAKSDRLQER